MSATSQDPIRTMSADAHDAAQWSLLDELADLLEMTQDHIEHLRDQREKHWPDADAAFNIKQINTIVEVLDALGHRELDAPTDLEKGEGEDR